MCWLDLDRISAIVGGVNRILKALNALSKGCFVGLIKDVIANV